MGFSSGELVFECYLKTHQGQRTRERLVQGALEGSARATPLGARVEYAKGSRFLRDVKTKHATQMSSGSQPAA